MTDKQGRHQRLRQLREERGWTQQAVADQLARVAWLRNHERVGVNADMVAKWERGSKTPSARYRDLLCLLHGVTAEYLGFTPTRSAKPAAEGSTSLSTVASALVDALGGAAAVLDQLGPAGGILQARMFETWKEDVMQRRALLKLIGLSPVIAALPASAEPDRSSRSGKPTPENVRDLDHLADRYQALYHSTAPAALMTPVVAHLRTLGDLLRQGPAPAERTRLLVNRSRVATLAGRLAFFDLQDPMSARAYYNLALEAARRARETLDRPGALTRELPWFDYYDGIRLAGFAGYATLQAGRLGDARTALTGAVAKMPAQLSSNAPCCSPTWPPSSCKAATSTGPAVWPAMLPSSSTRPATRPAPAASMSSRAAVNDWKNTAPVRALDEQLAALR